MAQSRDENGAETYGTKCYHICFHIFCRSGNEYRNPRNEYENRYYQKQTRSEYKADMEKEVGVDQNIKPLSHREIIIKKQI